MGYFDAPLTFDDVSEDIGHLLVAVEDALRQAITDTAAHMDRMGLSPEPDPQFVSSMIRRFAMESLKALDPDLSPEDNLGLNMSGLMITLVSRRDPDKHYALRIRRADDEGNPPAMTSETCKRFCRQARSPQGRLVLGDIPEKSQGTNLLMVWGTDASDLALLKVVLPYDVDRTGEVACAWTEDVLSTIPSGAADDLDYGDAESASDDGSEAQSST